MKADFAGVVNSNPVVCITKATPIKTPSVAPARQTCRPAPKTCRGKMAANRSAASGIRIARYVSGGQWSSTPRATAKVEPQMSVVRSIAASAPRCDLSFIIKSLESEVWRLESRKDKWH